MEPLARKDPHGLRNDVRAVSIIWRRELIYPGVLVMSVLFTAIFSAASKVRDREFGFLREILVAPVSRASIVVGKCLGGAPLPSSRASSSCSWPGTRTYLAPAASLGGKDKATPGGYGGKPPGVAFIGAPTGARNAGTGAPAGDQSTGKHVTPNPPLVRQDRTTSGSRHGARPILADQPFPVALFLTRSARPARLAAVARSA
jgi:hypothetical protein